jgi:hypothetical protein
MSDLRTIMERGVGGATPPPDGFERMLRRRDRKRLSQRITAGVVGVVVFAAAIWVVTTGGPFDRTLTPGGGEIVTEPTDRDATIPLGAAGAGLIGLPPEGATPSTPTRGELVLRFGSTHGPSDLERFNASVYANGRLIWTRLTEPMPGLIEQRLTPEGVELIRSAFLSTGLFDHDRKLAAAHGLEHGVIQIRVGDRLVTVSWGDWSDPDTSTEPKEWPTPEEADALQRLDVQIEDPASWLPAGAWADREMKPYIPTRYDVCIDAAGVELDQLLASLPQEAEDLFRSWDRTLEVIPQRIGPDLNIWCSDVTTEDARTLAAIFDEADLGRRDMFASPVYLSYALGTEVSIGFWAQLPDEVA